jgi:hypothetical protein
MRVPITVLLILLSTFAFLDSGKAEQKILNLTVSETTKFPSSRVQEIMADMIRIQYPGVSTYSRVQVDPAICLLPEGERPRHCEKPGPLCGPPGENILGIQGCTRSEDWEEAMHRYRGIAESIHRIGKRASMSNCDLQERISKCNVEDECGDSKSCRDKCTTKGYKSCRKDYPWRGKQTELEAMMTVVAANESGYRKDIQLGIGEQGLGDCAWEDPETHKRVKAWTEGGRPILTTCQSFCVAQINYSGRVEIEGYKPTELIGDDPVSLDKCFEVSAEYLSRWRGFCLKKVWLKKTGGDWAKGTFTGYGTGSTCGPAPWGRWVRRDGKRVRESVYKNTEVKGKCTFKNECLKWMESRPIIKFDLKWEEVEDPRFVKRSAQFWTIMNNPKSLKERELAVFSESYGSDVPDSKDIPEVTPASFHSQ